DRDPDGDACKVPVYSTSGAADGSDSARVIRDAMRRCPHKRSPGAEIEHDPEAATGLAAGTLSQVAALLEAAEGLLAQAAANRDADEVVRDALKQLAEDANVSTDLLDEQVARLKQLARHQGGRAHPAAARAGAADPWPPRKGTQTLLESARERLDEADGFFAVATGSREKRTLVAEG